MALTTMTTAIPRQWSRFSLAEKKRREKLSLIDSQRELRGKNVHLYREKKRGVSLLYDARDTDKKPNKYCIVSLYVKTILRKKLLNRAK